MGKKRDKCCNGHKKKDEYCSDCPLTDEKEAKKEKKKDKKKGKEKRDKKKKEKKKEKKKKDKKRESKAEKWKKPRPDEMPTPEVAEQAVEPSGEAGTEKRTKGTKATKAKRQEDAATEEGDEDRPKKETKNRPKKGEEESR